MNPELRVLVVEDDPAVRKLIKITLARAGYRPFAAENGTEALNLLQDQAVEVVLTDINMPSMGGLALYQEIQAEHPQLPVIFMSGAAMERDDLPPGSLVLNKPFRYDDLMAILRSALPQLAKEARAGKK